VAPRDPAHFCFVHAADLHLDTPFHGIGEVAPFVAQTLREASLAAFDAIVELTIERDAAFLVVAGDVYDGADRGLRAQLRFREGLERLSHRGIRSFVVHGNHDPVLTGWSAIRSWPELVTIFGTELGVATVDRDGIPLATVQGISYATAATEENLALRFSRPAGPGLAVGVLHCNLTGVASGYANYSACTIEDLRRTNLDYLALGHIHERRVLAPSSGSSQWVVYPGNSQARSPRASERSPKGAVVVHVSGGAVTEVEFVACDRVRFDEIDCDIARIDDLGELEDALGGLGRQRLADADGRSLVLRARLSGRGSLHRDLARSGAVEGLLSALRDGTEDREPFVWWDAVVDDSAPELDLAAIRQRGDFVADLLEIGESLALDDAMMSDLAAELAGEAPRALASRARELL